jgi:two-component system cell cycle response regulator
LEDRELGEEAIRHGAQDFLVKGKMFGALLWRAIRYSVERHRIMEELRAAAAQK